MPQIISQSLPISFFPFNLSFNLRVFWLILVPCLFVLLVVSIVQLNSYTKEIYLIKNYQAQIRQLTEQNKILEVSFSQGNSLKNISQYSVLFEKAEKIEYIRVLESKVAARPK